ncbi:MAG TPA: hypothetical protein DCK98_01165 [Chloroflexi bacterium]|nr:hypothetical protein [Chloroflexota bacterium]HAL27662.1 hypothetical protein [Chloroflexota bacterium]
MKVARRVWYRCIVAYIGASTVAGAVFGGTIGLLGSAVVPGRLLVPSTVFGLAALACALVELHVVPVTPPFCARSVPQEWWRRFRPTYAAIAYGAVLGIGVTTVIPFAAFYFVLFTVVLAGPLGGALILAAYGFGRAVPVLVGSLAISRGLDVAAVAGWPITNRPRAHMACATVLIAVASILLLYPLLSGALV